MKKIGVITWFDHENYGTVLQAIALQEYIKLQGMEPSLLKVPDTSINSGLSRKKGNNFLKRLQNSLLYRYVTFKYRKALKLRAKKFHEIIYNNYNVCSIKTSFADVCNQFDMIICGSDQIWNPNWFSDFYFANFPQIKVPKISYAPSLGVRHLPRYLFGTYYNALKKFNKLSVREEDAKNEIVGSMGLSCKIVVDPVLLLEKKQWVSLIESDKKPQEEFILCYMLGNNRNHWSAIHSYAKKKKLKVVTIPMEPVSYLKKGEKDYEAGPIDFLTSIANAKIVITDSFHATVFSIIFQKPFYVFERMAKNNVASQNSRIYNILELLGLNNRLLEYNSNYIQEAGKINFSNVSDKLEPIIHESKEFLNSTFANL